MKPNLALVRRPKILPYDTPRARRRMEALRRHLMVSAVKYVVEGLDGTRADRLRTASDLAGIPINLILAELERRP